MWTGRGLGSPRALRASLGSDGDPGRQWREGWVWAWSREELLGGKEAPIRKRREEEERGVLSVGIGGWRVTAGSAVASGRKRGAVGARALRGTRLKGEGLLGTRGARGRAVGGAETRR